MSEETPRVSRGLLIALAVVAVAHALSPLILRGMHSGLGWDETVYVSQIDPHVPAGTFSAPRARGLTLLTAPASLISSSLVVLRWWLALLSGVGLFLAFLPWLRARPRAVVPLAAALWSGLWVSTYYGFEAMPNQYVAYGAVAAAGWLLLAIRNPQRRRHVWYAAAAVAFTALMRPSDSVFLFLPLIAAVATWRGLSARAKASLAAVLAAGMLAGLAEWIIEAYVRFGGPVARFQAASAENTGGLHWSLGAQMRTLAGPILCRGSCHASAPVEYRLWWFALPVLVALGVWIVWRRERTVSPYLLATASGLSIAAEYVLAIGYAAPRFLEPTYALLALPAAEAALWLWRRVYLSAKPLAVAAAVVVIAGQEVSQVHLLRVADRHQDLSASKASLMADFLADTDVHRPCWVGGAEAGQIAFLAGCHVFAPDHPVSEQVHVANATLAVIEPDRRAPSAAVAGWPAHTMRELSVVHGWAVWRLNPTRSTPVEPSI
ncbi:MAG TPA: hypothetical protein VHB18_08300 [Mycobacteriales bacterium]|nr:hypothetical protein [Mycobacteriales bacterium]